LPSKEEKRGKKIKEQYRSAVDRSLYRVTQQAVQFNAMQTCTEKTSIINGFHVHSKHQGFSHCLNYLTARDQILAKRKQEPASRPQLPRSTISKNHAKQSSIFHEEHEPANKPQT
jgi:hypothetical protein